MGGNSTARSVEARRRATATRERRLAELASRQHGVLTRRQLLDAGLSSRTIERRVERRQLRRLHRGVFFSGDSPPGIRARWLGGVLACGDGALLSHRSAGGLWGLVGIQSRSIEISSGSGRGQPNLIVHECGIGPEDRTAVDGIPVTTVARTLFDLSEVLDADRLEKAFEEADRLRLLEMSALESVCARSPGRRALKPIRRLIDLARSPEMGRTPLEDRVLALCREHSLPPPATNVELLGHEVDALWPSERLVVEADGYGFHAHRAAFERDRARDAARQAAGYRVVRLTHRRLEQEPKEVAAELRRLLQRTNADRRAGS